MPFENEEEDEDAILEILPQLRIEAVVSVGGRILTKQCKWLPARHGELATFKASAMALHVLVRDNTQNSIDFETIRTISGDIRYYGVVYRKNVGEIETCIVAHHPEDEILREEIHLLIGVEPPEKK